MTFELPPLSWTDVLESPISLRGTLEFHNGLRHAAYRMGLQRLFKEEGLGFWASKAHFRRAT
jgi:hypothetical protein